jgi:putative nucleotidyltransferase with HDIG domain
LWALPCGWEIEKPKSAGAGKGIEQVGRAEDLALMESMVENVSLRRHMLAVEQAMRSYATKLGEDVERWGQVGLLHDFDYERWPTAPDHPLQGSTILRERGYPEEVIYAILSHADYLADRYPRRSLLDRGLYACDELCGFLVACAWVRPERLEGMQVAGVLKKMKTKGFAAAVNRDDIVRGAEEFGVPLEEHIANCIESLKPIANDLGLGASPSV